MFNGDRHRRHTVIPRFQPAGDQVPIGYETEAKLTILNKPVKMDIRAYKKIVEQYAWCKFNANHLSRFATNFGGPCWPNDKMQMWPMVERRVSLRLCPCLENQTPDTATMFFSEGKTVTGCHEFVKDWSAKTLALLCQSPKRAKAMKVKHTESS